MADYEAAARTNYFKVKDVEAFTAFISKLNDCVIITTAARDGDTLYGFYCETDHGTFPCTMYDEETHTHTEIDVVDEIAKHLAPNSVAVFMETGHEKMRYVDGWACAVDNSGKQIHIHLTDIYDQAKAVFGSVPMLAEY